MGIHDWYWGWVRRHIDLFPRGDWPALDLEFWRELRHLFVTRGVTEAVANEASRRMFPDPPEFVGQHPATILAQVRAIWHGRPRLSEAQPDEAQEDYSQWDACAAAHWQSLTEPERDEWRALVRRRAPFFSFTTTERARELLCQAWAYDPAWVIADPGPQKETARKRGPRRAFEEPPVFVPFESAEEKHSRETTPHPPQEQP